MSDQKKRGSSEGFRAGVRQGLGVLSAFKDAVEETIEEARERGDLSSERAREIVRTTLDRAQSAAEEARERFDFVARREHEELRARVEELADRLSGLEKEIGGEGKEAPASGAGEGPTPEDDPQG